VPRAAVAVPFAFVGAVLTLGASSYFLPGGNLGFGALMIAGGLLVFVYAGWRLKNPEWRTDPFWEQHPQWRNRLGPRLLPWLLSRWLSERRLEQAGALSGFVIGVGAIAFGLTMLAAS
jgi:hypothetical protein